MTTDLNDENVIIDDAEPSIGERLRDAREAKKLSIAEVATQLRLTKHIIEHIENERWVELHGRAYARGYLSNYVKFLGLPEDDLLFAFNREYRVLEANNLAHKHKQQEITNHKKTVWLPSVLFIILIVAGWFAYQQWLQTTSTTDINDGESSSLSFQNTMHDELVSASDTIVPQVQLEDSGVESSLNDNVEQVIANEENTVIPVSNAEITSEDMTDTALELDVSEEINTVALEVENTVVTPLEGEIDLQFSDECWVEVRDAESKILLSKIMHKDDSIVLKGKTPLSIMLGRVSAVKIKFNKQEFDTAPYTQRDVARFTLGAES